ncbi:glycine betaine uptake BCCT transporter [Lederbergia galactosidilytica]|uniref:Glycine/betaine ABC transporter permease n=1 Tax=Lederbergia galactosidilytica TaxID=217031 RepID=A0A178A1V6_9BACI|nr:BCCT family transporter [Lederbergia galactosidilytica]KRG12361.1 glycine/betaine ABC transporter permease [Virgibacillus soli]OAK73893.1 glycine/betaine ABC transporter permease [Lederbergia galactosidilytica]
MKKISNVFWISAAILVIAVIYGVVSPNSFEAATSNIKDFITTRFGWYYLILVSVIVIFCIFLIFSPVGTIRLGKQDEKPEFSSVSWFAMLFSAGMGIGLVFWGAAEPISHFAISPPTAEPGSNEALKESMRYTFFHWGIHAWAIYALVGLSLAFFNFRKDQPGLISATLGPILGKYTKSRLGVAIDIIAVLATVIGVGTTLGFGAAQINGGLAYLFDIPISFPIQLIIIAIVTVLFIISAWSGLSKGIQYLSNTNMILAILLLILVFAIGPTLFILNMFTDTLGVYIQNIIQMSFRIAPLTPNHREWINDWTIFYWAWWISWSPFVGIFIARVSRGRTIREFVIGVLLLPAIVSFIWFTVFGATAIEVQQSGAVDLTQFATEEVLFAVFNNMPMSILLSIVGIALVAIFFITSADSATFVLGMQTTYGSLTPPNTVKLAWGIIAAAMASILLYSGGLDALQNALIIVAFPFSVIIILMMLSLYKALAREKKELGLVRKPREPKPEKKREKVKKKTPREV